MHARHFLPKAALAAAIAAACRAQAPGGGGTLSHAKQLALSGAASNGSVSAAQTTGSGVNTVVGSVQVNGTYSGSVPLAPIPSGPIQLTIRDAVKYGLQTNLGPISASNAQRVARAQRLQLLSALLPSIVANASNTVSQVDLAAYGFQFKATPSLGFAIPAVVGPFNYSSLEGQVNQTVFDLVQRRNWRSGKAAERSATLSSRDSRDVVVLAIGGTYLQTLSTAARIASQQAQVDNARAIYQQALIRKQAGTNARIDVSRSQVELQTEEQRLTSYTADYKKQIIQLARLIGLPQDRELKLADSLDATEVSLPETDAAIRLALERRNDLKAAQAQVQAAEFTLSAARAERLPSGTMSGYYGVMGPNPTTGHGVFAVTGSVDVPIFQGGRIGADIQQAQATLDQRRAELANLKADVEQSVRDALIELETALGQTKVAQSNRTLAADTLTQARDRFAAGVSTTVEVVQAQQQLAGAESDYISSLFSMDLARLSLARAMGDTESGLIAGGSSRE